MHSATRCPTPLLARELFVFSPGARFLCIFLFICATAFRVQAARPITLAWDRNPESDLVAGYKVHRGLASGVYTTVIDVGNVTTFSVQNLVAGTTNFFAVTAYNQLGLESIRSAEQKYLVPNLPPALNSVENCTLTDVSAPHVVPLSGIGPGAVDEMQRLTVTAVSSDPRILPHPVVTYASPSSTGTLRLSPVPNTSGSATITVSVSDGYARTDRSFVVTIKPGCKLLSLTRVSPAGMQVTWASRPEFVYRVQYKTNLNQPSWITLSGTVMGLATNTSWTDLTASNDPARFYRIEMVTDALKLGYERPAVGGALVLSWNSHAGTIYRILSKTNLSDRTWTDLSGLVPATSAKTFWTNSAAATVRARFYVVEAVVP